MSLLAVVLILLALGVGLFVFASLVVPAARSWVAGAVAAALSLVGLILAAQSEDGLGYYAGLFLFAICLLAIFSLVKWTFDEAEKDPAELAARERPADALEAATRVNKHVVAAAIALVAVGTVVFHFLSPWWWTPIASNWGYVDDTIILTFWITGVVFVAIILFMAYCIYRYRYQEGRRSTYDPENKKMEWWLTGLTTVGVAGMLTPGLFVWDQFVTVPKEATEFEVLAKQWQFAYRLPGKDGVLGTSDARNISASNPFGLNPNDPNGRDDVLVDGGDLHLPLGKPVKVLLRSIDVLHDFYVPEFRAKMDMVPGMITYFWFTPTRTGKFDVLCFELCGVGHYAMRSKVVVLEGNAYQAWLGQQPTFAQSLARAGSGKGGELRRVSNEQSAEATD